MGWKNQRKSGEPGVRSLGVLRHADASAIGDPVPQVVVIALAQEFIKRCVAWASATRSYDLSEGILMQLARLRSSVPSWRIGATSPANAVGGDNSSVMSPRIYQYLATAQPAT